MAPPKMICSVYAEVYSAYAQVLKTIADIRAIILKAVKVKNAILFGSMYDAAAAELISAAYAVAATIASQVLSKASSLAAAAIEAFLGPLITILILSPSSILSLINLPLKEAIKSAEAERRYLSRARTNLDFIVMVISKWSLDIGGGKYASKMEDALPYIIKAIEKCNYLIKRLDAASSGNASGSAYFDTGIYNSMRGDLATAIEITKSDSILVNSQKIEDRIEKMARAEYVPKINAINIKYREDKRAITKKFNEAKVTFESQAEYASSMTRIDSKRKIDIEAAKLTATTRASMSKDLYKGIINDIRDQFAYDMQKLIVNLESMIENLGKAYLNNRNCQSMTYTTYNIRNVISSIISQIIKLLTNVGNGAGSAVNGVIRLSKSMMEKVKSMYETSLNKFYSSEENISSTGLAANLAAGNGLLITSDTLMASTITQSIMNLINSDEALSLEQEKFNTLFSRIEGIKDWDGTPNVWGTNPLNAASTPYPKLILSITSMLSTLVVAGLTQNEEAVSSSRKRIVEISKSFRNIYKHNIEVLSAITSYTPQSSIYVEQLRKELEKLGPLWAILAAFNVGMILSKLAADAINQDLVNNLSLDDIPTVSNCKIAYPELFDPSAAMAEKAINSLRVPAHFYNNISSFEESVDLKREQAISDSRRKEEYEYEDIA